MQLRFLTMASSLVSSFQRHSLIRMCLFLFALPFSASQNQLSAQVKPISKIAAGLNQFTETETETSLLIAVKDYPQFLKQYKDKQAIKIISGSDLSKAIQIKAKKSWIYHQALSDSNIIFIAPHRTPFLERELTGFDLSVNQVNLAHREFPTINGKGYTVSIKENRPDTNDIDFKGRYRHSPAASPLLQTHATTMATIAAGAGNSYYTGKGVAWGAFISSSNFSNLLPDPIAELQQLGVHVQNHSYGVGIENYYGADAMAYDEQVFLNPKMVHVFSAGNMGNVAGSNGRYQGLLGFANLTGSFKMSKNSISVGAIDSFGQVISISSRGPAFDGRIKPEIVALGEDGTSGAAAIVSGTAILFQDALVRKTNIHPPASLVKSILINSADKIGNQAINFKTGFGSVNVYQGLQLIEKNQFLTDSIQSNRTHQYSITLPPNAVNLTITLCWTDPAASANQSTSLVNDLDISLIQNNQSWLPWVLNTHPSIDSLNLLPIRHRDSLNNVEQISIEHPPTGSLLINIASKFIQGPFQHYSISWKYDSLHHFKFTYPVKSDNFFPNQTHLIKWETSFQNNGILQYKISDQTWKDINPAVNLSKRQQIWKVLDTIETIQLRMQVGNQLFYSDTLSITQNLNPRTGYVCQDSGLIYWPKMNHSQFMVYQLTNQYLTAINLTQDTIFKINPFTNASPIFSVAPVLSNQVIGVKAYGFDYKNQQVGCYIKSFLANPFASDSAHLVFALGTIYDIAEVIFEKLVNGQFKTIKTFLNPQIKDFNLNSQTQRGINQFRVKILLKNGTLLLSNVESVFQFTQDQFQLFPNPVQPGKQVNLLTETLDDTKIIIYTIDGKIVNSIPVEGFLTKWNIPFTYRGIYYISFFQGDQLLETRKLIVQ